MNALRYAGRTERSPLQQAKRHERLATYSIALIVGIVVILVARSLMVAITESPTAQSRLMNAIFPVAQLIVSLATLALVHHQTSLAVRQMEQAEQTDTRISNLTEAVHALVEAQTAEGARSKTIPAS